MTNVDGSTSSKWDDLKVRVVSGAVMLAVGLFAIVLGGSTFQMLVVFATGVMIWELLSMMAVDRPSNAMLLGVGTAAIMSVQLNISGFSTIEGVITTGLFCLVPVLGATFVKTDRLLFIVFAVAICLATVALIGFRNSNGLDWVFWVLLVVVASDTFGYLAGRTFGGPKFWPKVSPKKTWSGTIAGWVGAAIVGLLFVLFTDATTTIIWISVLVAFAGQMGDIAESALKRRVGIKDSSDLIPGHGGLLDRFDAMLGAVLFLFVLIHVLRVPGVAF